MEEEKHFNRSSIQQGPRWRWSRAEEMLLADQDGEATEGPQDYYVYLAYRMGRLVSDPSGRKWARAKWPILWDVYTLGYHTTQLRISRASLEACLLAGLTPREVANKLTWLSPMHVKLYSKWFFDLDGVRNIQEWVDDYILEPYRKSSKDDCKPIALILAFDGHLDDALAYLLTGRAPEDKLYKQLRANERNKYISNYIMKGPQLPVELAAPLVENAIKQEEELDRAASKELSKAGVSLTEEDIAKLQAATEKYADSQAAQYSTGPDGVEVLPGMDTIRERLAKVEEKVDKE